MPTLKKTRTILHNEHVEEDTGHYINVRKWLSRIYKVIALDKLDEKTGLDKVYILDGEHKLLYAYLFNFGKAHGFHNIYPNYTLICEELGINDRKLSRKLQTLSEVGLITIIKNKSKNGKFDSNQYRVNTPKTIAKRKWYNVNGDKLEGKLYRFDSSLFR
ncbi:coil containing protein [Vibrio phage 1.084.O._10N.261.49.F5]|nr:coil containing protein [Vibrio phage 1.084.O._10N.261.49.F5]